MCSAIGGLVGFLRVAHELFQVEFPEEEIKKALSPRNPDEFNEEISAILISHGWKETLDGLFLFNSTGMVMAHIRLDLHATTHQQNWFGGFFYCTPYPEDVQERRREIKAQLFLPCEEEIQQYEKRAPGLLAASIHITSMTVTSWNRNRVRKNTQDFKDWKRIFERLFQDLNFPQRYCTGEQMLEAMYDDFWQWTDTDPKILQEKLKEIGDSARDEAEVKRRVREELAYTFEEIYLVKKWALAGKNLGFCVEIVSPKGRDLRIRSHPMIY